MRPPMAIMLSRCWSRSNDVRPNTTAVAESVEVYCALTPKIDTWDCGSNLRTYPASAPTEVPSFGLFENVGSRSQGEGAFFGSSGEAFNPSDEAFCASSCARAGFAKRQPLARSAMVKLQLAPSLICMGSISLMVELRQIIMAGLVPPRHSPLVQWSNPLA